MFKVNAANVEYFAFRLFGFSFFLYVIDACAVAIMDVVKNNFDDGVGLGASVDF